MKIYLEINVINQMITKELKKSKTHLNHWSGIAELPLGTHEYRLMLFIRDGHRIFVEYTKMDGYDVAKKSKDPPTWNIITIQ